MLPLFLELFDSPFVTTTIEFRTGDSLFQVLPASNVPMKDLESFLLLAQISYVLLCEGLV